MGLKPLQALAAAAIFAIATPAAAAPSVAGGELLHQQVAAKVDRDLRPFYAARGFRPLWMDNRGRFGPAVDVLVRRIGSARLDGIKAKKLRLGGLRKALDRAATGKPADVGRAEARLSQAFATYVRLMRAAPRGPMIYETEALAPVIPTSAAALQAAAAQPDLARYIERMGWMHPLYAPVRDAMEDPRIDEQQRRSLWQTLARLRAIPANPAERYVLVDAASARLWMYERGKPVDSMRVVVGKPATPTPMMAGFLRYAIGNPYWNVPVDMVQTSVAWHVRTKGVGYLSSGGYQVLSDWSDNAAVLDPQTIDWNAVAARSAEVRVRQKPGPTNFMGRVKFEFPNAQGIYLHDTPELDLMRKDQRQFSNGCVRLEDANRFGRWLLGRPLPRRIATAEQRIDLPQVVPIYITYLTAMPEKGQVAFRSDVYGRDAMRLARRD